VTTSTKSERLLNLLIMLLVQKRYVGKQRIREILYPDSSPDAFEKMFERDKEELRSLGIPIEVGQLDAYFDDEPGYRVRPDALALPEIRLEADEAAVVGLATKVWQHARMARATSDAVRKLAASGADLDLDALSIIEPRLVADEPSFEAFLEAVQERTPVRFTYRRPDQEEATVRHLQPWGVTRNSGRWYVVGFDTDRGDERVFRLSRVEGQPVRDGAPGSFEVPADVDLGGLARRLAPPGPVEPLVLLVRTGAALALRRGAETAAEGVRGPDGTAGWDRLNIPEATSRMLDEVLSFGADVVVEAPEHLRRRIIERLDATVEAS
jgi:proteasome accessory factor B